MSQAKRLLHLRVPDYILISVVTLSICLFFWQRYGMNYHSIINPVANQPYLFNDNDYGGTSQSELTSTRDNVSLSCDTQRSDLTFPFCSVYIPLVPEESERGLDLSKYNEINIHLVFEGSLKDTVLVYVQNDEIDLKSMAMRRANMAILTPVDGAADYRLAIEEFHLPSWWIFDHLELTSEFNPKFDNVKRIQISTGDNRQPRHTDITVGKITLIGKWLNQDELYVILIGIWFLYAIFLVSYKGMQLARSYNEVSRKAKKLANLNELLLVEKDKFESLSKTDPLTKALNRAGMRDPMMSMIELYQSDKTVCSLILFDIDHFKRINDLFGHDIGDHVLTAMAQLVRANIRSDTIFARWGGEEFAIICPRSNANGAKLLANKLRVLIAENMFIDKHKVTCSFGVSEYRGQDVDRWFKRADKKLYKAKSQGRNRVEV